MIDYAMPMAECPETLTILAPEDGRILQEVPLHSEADITTCLVEADSARPALASESPSSRAKRLLHLADAINADHDLFTSLIRDESGKPQRYARGEVDRAIQTFQLAAEVAACDPHEELSLNGRRAFLTRFPKGVCSFITPFNFPLNLVAHKIAPALAIGCPFVLKPAEKTPLSALHLGKLISKVEPSLPPGAFHICVALPQQSKPLIVDPRVRHLSFTGSAEIGWMLKRMTHQADVTLELGGNAASILCDDWDFKDAIQRLSTAAFAYSGQVCISLQRLFVSEALFEQTLIALAEKANNLNTGPLDKESTEFGPMIQESAAIRIEEWVNEAVQAGAKIVCGGKRDGSFYAPTVLRDVPHDCKIWSEEAFGPVVCVESWSSFDEALAKVNDSRWGLQASVLTHDRLRMERAWHELEVGQVIIGDGPSFRVDSMPYGGVKESGVGREGIRWATEAMTEPRLLVLPEESTDQRI